MKARFSQSNYQESEINSLMNDIEKTKYALENAYAGFDNATDPDLIDCYIYEVNSVLKRYKFLLEQAAKIRCLNEAECEQSLPLCQESPVSALVSQTLV